MEYKVITKLKYFKIIENSSKNLLVEVFYKSIWNSDASFTIDNVPFEIKANNAWQTKFDIFKNQVEVGDISYNWKGEVIIRLRNNDLMTKHFIFKTTSMMADTFTLKDFLTNHLWTIKTTWEWAKMKHYLLIKRESGFEEEENNINELELMVVTTYVTLLYMGQMQGAA